jgi:hypothetical protein
MTLKEKLKSDLKDAMRAKDIVARDAIRSINTMIKQIEVDQRVDLNDEEVIKLILKGVKQRDDAITQYKAGNRDDLVQIEQEQINIFNRYLPKPISDDALEVVIQTIIDEAGATSMKDMGKVMNPAKEKLGATADGKRINMMVKKLLG